jgi:hypothetical protein
MVSCHRLKRAAAMAEDLEAMQYLSKIFITCVDAMHKGRAG